MKLNFDSKFADLKGEVKENAMHKGEYLANLLAGDETQKNNAIKFYDWAMVLYKREVLDVDKQDAELLQQFIGDAQGVAATLRAQLKTIVNDAISKEDKKK